MAKGKLLENIIADPARFYRAPFNVVRDRRFKDDERLRILAAWEKHLNEELGSNPDQLQLVTNAKQEITKRRPAG